MKKCVFVLLVIFASLAFSQTRVAVIEDSIFSRNINSYMRFNVILPANYYLNEERYITIYLLHGYSGDQDDWINRTGLVSYLKDYNFIVVTPDGKNSWYTNSPLVKNKNFEDYIIKDLIPFVDKKYRALSTRHGRAIAGLSMGGYGAMKFALKYPGLFFYAGSFSGALHYPESLEEYYTSNVFKGAEPSLKEAFGEKRNEHWRKNDPIMLVDSIQNQFIPYLYISCGKDDPVYGIAVGNHTFIDKLRKKGCLYEYHELPGVHNWVFWDKEIEMFLLKISKFDPLKP